MPFWREIRMDPRSTRRPWRAVHWDPRSFTCRSRIHCDHWYIATFAKRFLVLLVIETFCFRCPSTSLCLEVRVCTPYVISTSVHICLNQRCIQTSGDGVKLSVEDPWSSEPLPKKMKASRFSPTLISKAPFRALSGPLAPDMGTMRPKIGRCRHGIDPLMHVNYLFSFNIDSERLQYFTARIINWPPGSKRGRGIQPFHLPWLRYRLTFIDLKSHCCYSWRKQHE